MQLNSSNLLKKVIPIFLVLIGWHLGAQVDDNLGLSFNHLQVRDGLSEGTNAWVYRDSFGFVWISSLDGLNRFDGSTVKVYKANPADSTSLNDNIITSTFFEDDESNLWFTSYNAIHKYVRQYDHFEVYTLKDTSGNPISEDYLGFHLYDGKFWVKTGVRDDGLLHLFDINSKVDSIVSPLQGYRQNVMENGDGEPVAVVSSFLFAESGIRILPLTNDVVFRRQDFFSIKVQDQYPASLVQQVEIVSPEELWLSSPLGLLLLNPVSGDYTIFNESVNGKLGRVSSTSVYRDLLFVATANNGLHLFDRRKKAFTNQFLPSQNLDFQLRKKDISMITIDDRGCLWVSYYEDLKPFGLDYAELYINRFPKFAPKTGGPNYVTAIADINGDILINDFNYLAQMVRTG